MRLSLLGLAVIAATVLLAAPGADAARVKVGGRVYGVMPSPSAVAAASQRSVAAAPGRLTTPALAGGMVNYNGGPVLHTTAPYVIYWDPTGTAISARSEQVINQYLTDVAADSGETDDAYGVGRQYFDGAGIANAGQSFSAAGQAFIDTDAYPTTNNCPAESGYTNCITDAQLQTELATFVTNHGLPTDGPTSETELPADAPVYFLILPATVNTCFDQTGGSQDCSGGPQANFGYCAYHSAFTDGANGLLYANVPFSVFTELGTKGCQSDNTSPTVLQAPNNDPADNIVDDLSHELNETITDPLGSAWYSDSTGNEIGDNCQAYGSTADPANGFSPNAYEPTLGGSAASGTLYDQLINGDQYYTQSEWSNGQGNCEMQPTAATLTPAFNVTGAVPGQAALIDPSSTVSAAGVASIAWNWGDGTSSFVPGGAAVTTHTFPAAGIYTVTSTVVDGNGNLAKLTKQVSVGRNPTAVIGNLPAVTTVGTTIAFSGSPSTDPNGTSISNFSWNFGDGTTGTRVAPTHSYGAPGRYTVTLSVSDSYGFAASTTARIDVVPVGRIISTSAHHSATSAYALVKVTQGGSISYAGHSTKLAGAGTAKVKLTLTAGERRKLAQGRKFTLTVKLVYRPDVGKPVTETKRLTL